jgi:hypothetical protein
MQKVGARVVASVVMALACLVGPASAANIYKPETTPDLMFKVVERIVGGAVTPIFIMGDEPLKFMADVDSEAVVAAGVKEETMRYYLAHLKPESKAYGITGYALGGSGVPGNEVRSRTCAIVVSSSQQMKTTTTMFHEAIHCKNFAALRDDPVAWRLASSLNSPALGMTNNQFMSLFEEVLAAYMQSLTTATRASRTASEWSCGLPSRIATRPPRLALEPRGGRWLCAQRKMLARPNRWSWCGCLREIQC